MKKFRAAGALLLASALLVTGCGKSSKAKKLDPADYYKYVEEKSVDEGLKAAKSSFSWEKGFSNDFSLKLSLLKEGKALAKTFLGAAGESVGVSDLDWLNTVELGGNISVSQNALSANVAAGVNGAKLGAELAMDDGAVYARVPELNSKYLSFSSDFLSAFSGLNVADVVKAYVEYLKAIPDYAGIVSEVQKYKDVYLKYATDVSKSTASVEEGGVSQEFTVLTVRFVDDQARGLVTDILELLKDDECIKNILESYGVFQSMLGLGAKGGLSYDEFADKVDELLEEVDEYGLGEDASFEQVVYVNSRDEICGRTIKMGDEELASYVLARDGKKFGFNLSAGGSAFGVSGSGKASGDVYNGSYTVSVDGSEVQDFTLEGFDAKAAKKGILKGKLSLVPSVSDLSAFKLALDFNAAQENQKYAIAVLQDSKKLVTADYSVKLSKASSVKVPSKAVSVEDEDGIKKYTKELKFGNLKSIIKKARVPKELESQLNEGVDSISAMAAEGL